MKETCGSEIEVGGRKISCECPSGHMGTHGSIVGKVQGVGSAEYVDISWYEDGDRVHVRTSEEGRRILETGENIYLPGYEVTVPEIEVPEVFLDWWESFQGVK